MTKEEIEQLIDDKLRTLKEETKEILDLKKDIIPEAIEEKDQFKVRKLYVDEIVEALVGKGFSADEVKADTINEKTAAAGVTIDGVKLKDSEPYCDAIKEKTADTGVTVDGCLIKDGVAVPAAHDLDAHGSATLAELNAKVSDATLDDSGDPRTPSAHDLAGSEHNADTLADLNAKISDATLDDSGDARTPSAHKASHEDGGSDEPNVSGLVGLKQFLMGVGPTDNGGYWNYKIPIGPVYTDFFTLVTGAAPTFTYYGGCAGMSIGTDNSRIIRTTNSVFYDLGHDNAGGEGLLFSTSKKVIIEFGAEFKHGSQDGGIGFSDDPAISFVDYDDQTIDSVAITFTTGAFYFHTANAGVGHTETEITGVTVDDFNRYRIEFDPGVDAKLYVNGTLKATISTNLPDGDTNVYFGFGSSGNVTMCTMLTDIYCSIET